MSDIGQERWMDVVQDERVSDVVRVFLERPENDDKTFSREALEDATEKLLLFVVSRTMAEWQKTGQPPKHVLLTLSCDFTAVLDEEKLEEQPFPWYHRKDGVMPDGGHRNSPYTKDAP